ncbi:TonB family protein [Paucibacter sp. APW11]|uniref:TonB family protein n=1 Tax=Roseateles aquae TaxID=3077235 RepID=A0ABU3PDU5_9BURK|nr:TonB family protein [Paucibacter sp. APW11]MDT9000769.1 TonB family protein [Paucibacter sp. APW11]
MTDAERAKRDADKVFQWIKFHADKSPRPGSAAAAPAPAPAPAARPVTKTAATPRANNEVNQAAALSRDSTVRETVVAAEPAPQPEAAPVQQAKVEAAPAPATAAAPAPAPAPAAQLLAVAPQATPQAPRVDPVPEAEVPLRLISRVEPEIPRQLINSLRTGRVLVRFVVQPDGRVTKAEPVETSNKKLSQSAVAAVQQWRFAAIPKAREATVEVGFSVE